jgi:effector-binding domain-containing protein/uncharacterized protein YndB with AHSA1/START domain
MKILKYILFIILGLLAVYLVLCAMGPKKMTVSKSMSINAAPESVFEEISNFVQWKAWSPWHRIDPKMVTKTSGAAGSKGHKQEWTSEHKQVGRGSQEFVEVRPNEYLKSEMKFTDFGDEASYSDFTLKAEGEGTNVTWAMESSEMPFIMRGMAIVFGFQKSMENDFNQGLTDMKKVVEAKPKPAAFAYDMTTIADTWYVGEMHTGLSMEGDLKEVFGNSYAKIGTAIGGMDKMTGHPFCIGHKVDYTTMLMDLEMAMPVAAEMKVADGLNCAMIPAGRAAQYLYYGPYEGTAEAWGKFMAAIEKDGLKPRFDGYEVYTNDPEIVKDPAKFETLLIQPVE